MLQQTQVATVIPYFQRFIRRFPTITNLAEAQLDDVLRLWQGLGYYSRAGNLHSAARQIVDEFGGRIPDEVGDLQSLPGVGRYTAGAIASIAFNKAAPILDGNVARVLCRLDAVQADPRSPQTRNQLWQRSEELVPLVRSGDFNAAMMDLGATVCTARNPKCDKCPIRRFCDAAKQGLQNSIPLARKSPATPIVNRWVFCIRHRNRFLIERRPDKGRWAGLWQFVTRDSPDLPANTALTGSLGQIRHALTHRRYVFEVQTLNLISDQQPAFAKSSKWAKLSQLPQFPMSRPHQRIAELLASDGSIQ
jgi:A/G-specific adenine glycosylase